MKVCGIVVTYNRKDELKKNIEKLLNQTLDMDILIVDNASTDGTNDMITEYMKKSSVIKCLTLEKNEGGSGGFYVGLKEAYERNYDFFILMDDDGRPFDNDTFLNLYNAYKKENNNMIIANSIVYCDKKEKKFSFGLMGANYIKELSEYIVDNKIYNHINPFNGTMISRDVVNLLGFPKKEFFISGDETEYSLRAVKNNCKLITIVNSEYYHPTSNCKNKKILGKTIDLRPSPIWRVYYSSRNYAYIYKQYYKDTFKCIIKQLIKALLLSEKPITRFIYTFRGVRDGYKEKFINDYHKNEKYKKIC